MSSFLELPLLTLPPSANRQNCYFPFLFSWQLFSLCGTQSNDGSRGPTDLVQHSAHTGATALLVLKLIWFWYKVRLSQWGGGSYFICSYYFLPAFAAPGGRGGGSQHPVVWDEAILGGVGVEPFPSKATLSGWASSTIFILRCRIKNASI